MLHSLLSIFFIFFVIYGIDAFGVIPSELSLRVNQTFNIECCVDKYEGELDFFVDYNVSVSDLQGSDKNINITRSRTCIRLTYRHSQPVRKNYTCRQNRNHSVGDCDVKVDERMAPVQNFKCRSADLSDVNCSFKQPASNLILNYKLDYSIDGDKMIRKATLVKDMKGGHSSKIVLPPQRKITSAFRFNLHALDKYHTRDESFDVKLLEILTPREIQNLTVLDDLTTSSGAKLAFALPRELAEAADEMIFDVRLKATTETAAEWKKVGDEALQLRMNGTNVNLTLDDLDFANTVYTVRIRIKSRVANDVEPFWSPSREVSFTTRPKRPEMAPETCDNCFNVMDNGNVVVYWKEVARNYQSGDNFCYHVVVFNETGHEIESLDLKETSLMLTRSKFNATRIKVKLHSKNRVGVSHAFSLIHVPLQSKSSKLFRLRKELVEDEYKISWKLLTNIEVESYSLFWCSQQANELPNQCDGAIDFRTVPATDNASTISSSESKQFGVSANFVGAPRGFEWAECTAAKPNQIGHVQSLWSSVDSEHSMTLHWKLSCVDEPITIGYNISYCALDEKDSSKCASPMESFVEILADDYELTQYEISGLKSYRLYNASVSLMSRTHLGVPSTPITVRTMEAAPTAPRDLKALRIAQTSMTLTWNRPIEVNGEAMTYQLWYNERKININHNETMNETFVFTLNELEPFTNYTITVVACTSDCSNSSDSLVFTTAMSSPSAMHQPKSEINSSKRMLVTWKAPLVANGNLNYFQLRQEFEDENRPAKVFRISGKLRACIIDGFTCDSELNLSIRGVNIEYNEETADTASTNINSTSCFANPEAVHEAAGYHCGDWSPPVYYSCLNKSSAMLIVIVSSFLVVMVLSTFLALKFYRRIIEMKAIHAKLPEGLLTSSSSSPSKDSRDLIMDLDLVKDHVLNDIVEEEEIHENDKLITKPNAPVAVQSGITNRDSVKSEAFLPFILNPRTNEITYHLPKVSMLERIGSQATSPTKSVSSKGEGSSFEEDGYTKMYRPQRPPLEIGSPVEGYLDMSGKTTPSPVKTGPANGGYTTNEIKSFIQDSEANNNGYIGKRVSILVDPAEKKRLVINSNGYVQQLK